MKFTKKKTIIEILKEILKDESIVKITLINGANFSGYVEEIGDDVLHLQQDGDMGNFDAFFTLKDIVFFSRRGYVRFG